MDFDFQAWAARKNNKPRLYMVLDCETATLPFAEEIALNAKQKKNIAIAKPLIYDIAWRIVDRYNNVYAEHAFIITEIFAVPAVFNTAYYKEKRPIYLDRLRKKETVLTDWYTAMEVFMRELPAVDFVSAYNAMFDFKKAIPFTELYINKLYSAQYDEWANDQYRRCVALARDPKANGATPDFDPLNFKFRGSQKAMVDIWGVSCRILVNTVSYKVSCLEHDMLTESGEFFKTSAESTYRYMLQHFAFEEAHTAIDDARIECEILKKALHRAKIPEGIIYFPFRDLGITHEFLLEHKKAQKPEYFERVIQRMENKVKEYQDEERDTSPYYQGYTLRLDILKYRYMQLFHPELIQNNE